MRWRTAKMAWSPGSRPELVGEPQRYFFQRDFVCSVLYASRPTPIVCKESLAAVLCHLMMDITDADAVHQAAQKVGSIIGDRNLVGLVNNAGIVVSGPLLYLRPSEYRRQLEVNMISPLVVIQAFAPLLGTDKKRQGPAGRIVNISSTGAKVAIPLIGAYSASKCGLEGMSDALRR